MEFTYRLLKSMKDTGKEVGIYSREILKHLEKSKSNFSDYSTRSIYYWRKYQRPIPVNIVLKIMNEKKVKRLEIDFFSVSGGNKVTFPENKDLRFCYILGLILGDGCLVHNKKSSNRNTYLIRITFNNRKEAVKIKKILKSIFNVEGSIYYQETWCELCLHSKPLVMILNKQYQIPIGEKYRSIIVPQSIKEGTKKMKTSFIKGVFDSDGNVYSYRKGKSVQLRQKSKRFIIEIKDLLESINLSFNNPYYDKANNSWLLWTSKRSLVDSFINKIVNFKI